MSDRRPLIDITIEWGILRGWIGIPVAVGILIPGLLDAAANWLR
jgi:hypothetical protein